MKKIFILVTLIFISTICFGQTEMEIHQQSNNAYKKADQEMTLVYKKVLKKLIDPNQRQLLIQAQRAWIKYKESHCKAIANLYEGGSMQPAIQADCLTELTKQRTRALQAYFEMI